MSGTTPDDADRDLLAAEYVIGLLDAAEARRIEAQAAGDPAMAALIARWEARLAPLAALVPPVAPPPELWQRLALATGTVPRRGRWGGVRLWRVVAAGSLALAASLAAVLFGRPPPPPALVAALSRVGAPAPAFLARVAPDGTVTLVPLSSPDVPPDRQLVLWALREGGKAPIPLGTLPTEGHTLSGAPAQPGTQMLLSEEPRGVPVGPAPTGPVVYGGALAPDPTR